MISPSQVTCISSGYQFREAVCQTYHHQRRHNPVYRKFCDLLNAPMDIKTEREVTYLPIFFWKQQDVRSTEEEPRVTFASSGTTGDVTSKHHLSDLDYYESSFYTMFHETYGHPIGKEIVGLLPSYLERKDSSLVYMVRALMKESDRYADNFFLRDYEALHHRIQMIGDTPIILFGVTYALLEFAKAYPQTLANTTIIETGGMKGMGRELTRQELHAKLKAAFPKCKVHSEYGMTEMLSQAYCTDGIHFRSPAWMKVSVRNSNDPLQSERNGKTGGLNIIDLANQESCAFIATEDLGRVHANGKFEVLGRFDHSDVRGCNLMAAPQ